VRAQPPSRRLSIGSEQPEENARAAENPSSRPVTDRVQPRRWRRTRSRGAIAERRHATLREGNECRDSNGNQVASMATMARAVTFGNHRGHGRVHIPHAGNDSGRLRGRSRGTAGDRAQLSSSSIIAA
jgi:hypothetical protein